MPLRLTRVAAICAALSGCALFPDREPMGPPVQQTLYAVTAAQRLVSFDAGQPQKLLSDKVVKGLGSGERILGMDYRVARNQLYALGSSGRLYRLDVTNGELTPVGAPLAVPLRGTFFGFDFNPTVDRIRVVSDAGMNLRLHPDTGAVVDSDPATPGIQTDATLTYDPADVNAGKTPRITAAGYTYNKADDKITTNFAIDADIGALVRQGSAEGTQPVVSPNTGRLFTVGMLNAGPFEQAQFDIRDVGSDAYAALTAAMAQASVLWKVDLKTGAATRIGTIGGGAPVWGIAVAP